MQSMVDENLFRKKMELVSEIFKGKEAEILEYQNKDLTTILDWQKLSLLALKIFNFSK
jgi:hypothetical protein